LEDLINTSWRPQHSQQVEIVGSSFSSSGLPEEKSLVDVEAFKGAWMLAYLLPVTCARTQRKEKGKQSEYD